MEKTINLKLNTSNVSNRKFFENLRGIDRRNLTEVLCVMRDNGVSNVTACGSALVDSQYNDIDLVCNKNFDYKCLQELKKRGAEIVNIAPYNKKENLGINFGNRYQFIFNGTNFDIGNVRFSILRNIPNFTEEMKKEEHKPPYGYPYFKEEGFRYF